MYVGRNMYNLKYKCILFKILLKIYNIVLIYATQQSDSVIHVCVLFHRLVVAKARVGEGRIGSLGLADAN